MDKTIKEILKYLISKEMVELRHKRRHESDEEIQNEIQDELDYLSCLFDKLTEKRRTRYDGQ